MAEKLTDKQKLFCQEYIKDLNATQAALRAGYSEKTAYSIGFSNLKKVEIQNEIQRLQAVRSKRTEITQDMVVKELAKVAFGNIGDLVSWNNEEVVFKPSSELSEDVKGSVSEITNNLSKDGFGNIKIKQHDKIKALDLLGRHLGMFTGSKDDDEGDEVTSKIEFTFVDARKKKNNDKTSTAQ